MGWERFYDLTGGAGDSGRWIDVMYIDGRMGYNLYVHATVSCLFCVAQRQFTTIIIIDSLAVAYFLP